MSTKRITKEEAAIIRKINSYPGCEKLKWVPCRICLEYCPDIGYGNRHAMCPEAEVLPIVRRKKGEIEGQGSLL